MRLLQILGLCCLLIVLASPATSWAVQPSSQVYGPVTPKETLSEIAKSVRGEWRIPLKYVVQAMYELNPQAFSETGINSLLIGSLLIVPDMKTLSIEAPELLSSIPKLAVSSPPVVVDNQQTQELRASLNEQAGVIDSLIVHNQNYINALKELTRQINTYQEHGRDLQTKLDTIIQQQKTNKKQITVLEDQIKSLKSPDNETAVDNNATETSQPDLYLILLLIPTLLALIAILMARRSPERFIEEETVALSEPLPEPSPDFSKFELADSAPEELAWTEDNKPEPETSNSPDLDMEPELVTEAADSEDSPLSGSFHNITADKQEQAASNAIEDSNDDVVTDTQFESTDDVDVSDELQALEEIDGILTEAGEASDLSNSESDSDIQQLKTAEDDIEAKLSAAYLHIDMGNSKQARETLDEINLVTFPKFTDKVDEIRHILEASSDQTQEVPAVELQELVVQPEVTNISIETQPANKSPHNEALNRVLKEQFKLANSYYQRGDMTQCKVYISKILQNDTPEYTQQALALLKKIQSQQSPAVHIKSTEDKQGQALEDLEKTHVFKPARNLSTKNSKSDPSKATGYHDLIPEDISSRFTAYANNKEGTKLALAYLFLDLNEINKAKQVLEKVLKSSDVELAREANAILEQLDAPLKS